MIHNISIATANDVTYFGDDVNIYFVFLPHGNYHLRMLHLNWLERTIVSDHSFCQFVAS